MKHIPTFEDFINESILNEGAIAVTPKDWDRMLDLVMKGDYDASKVAKLIKDKNKAMARFVAGLKLDNSPLKYEESKWDPYGWSNFKQLGNLAIELGATPTEIQNLYDSTEVPASYIEKMTRLAGKKLDNRFVGAVSKAVLDEGFDIKYLPHNGNAITNEGRYAMSKNGRKWTIGYKAEITKGKDVFNLFFDAITDEGDGPTAYHLDRSNSDSLFNDEIGWKTIGKNEFIAAIRKVLKFKK